MVRLLLASALAASAWAKPLWNMTTCGPWPSEPVFADEAGSFLAITSGRCLHIVDTSGAEVWRHLGSDFRTSAPAVDVSKGIVFYGHEAADENEDRFYLTAVNVSARRVLWNQALHGFTTRPVLDTDGTLILGDARDDTGAVFAVDAANGKMLWRTALPGAVQVAPAVGARIYVTDVFGTLSALDHEGSLLWQFRSKDHIQSSPLEHPDSSLVFVGAHRFRLFALNSTTGDVVWNFTTHNFMSSTPVLSGDGNELYFVSNDGAAYALESSSGRLIWRAELCQNCEWPPNSVPILTRDGSRVIVGGGEKALVVLNRSTGSELWRARLRSLSFGRALESADGGVFFVSSGLGQLSAWDANGVAASGTTCAIDNSWPPTVMSDNSHCTDIGISNLSAYRYGLPVATDSSSNTTFLPYFSSHALNGPAIKSITTAVIWFHGLLGNANKFFCDGLAAAESSGVSDKTLTLTPWFSDVRQDSSLWAVPTGLEATTTCWATSSWLKGGNSYPDDGAESSFALVDALVKAVRASKSFPNLKQITLAGFSAGCQLLTRWSFFSPVALETTTVVGDCGTYMYLDETRPDQSCNPLSNTGVNHTCDKFEVPAANISDCSGYDDYKYGINVSSVSGNNYVDAFAKDSFKLEEALTNFSQKKVFFLEGDDDVCQCNAPGMVNEKACFPKGTTCAPTEYSGCCDTYPDSTTANACSSTCEAMLTGSNRLQRGLNYAKYLETFYAKRGVSYKTQLEFFDGMHDNTAWGLSPHFSDWAGWTDSTAPAFV